jgi:glutamine synthetase
MTMKPKDVIELAKANDVKFIDVKFVDFPGQWQHTTLPAYRLDETMFEDGIAFDGSSIRGWQPINASDMIMIPDPTTAKIDPFYANKTLSLVASVFDPITKQPYSRDPRHIAKKAEAYLVQTGIADTSFMGPEAEFFLFDDVRFDQSKPNEGYYFLDSKEGAWNSGKNEGPNLGYKTRYKEGYFPVPPTDTLADIRQDMMLMLQSTGITVEVGHHEVATGGQCEIGFKFDKLLPCADNLLWFKYVVKNIARKHNKACTFMPKPLFGDNGSGMHVHQSLWKDGKPLFGGDGYAGLSQMALWYIGGIIKHAGTLAAFTNPTTNSYRRLVPGFEAPVNLAYSSRNRSASVRIPITGPSPKTRRIEVRFPDPSSNPYLAFAAMMMAGLDGIQNKIDPGDPLDKDIYALSPEELKSVPQMPGSLEQALGNLERDHEFLLRGDVFTKDAIEEWLDFKRTKELNPIRMRPTPHEFYLYFDT